MLNKKMLFVLIIFLLSTSIFAKTIQSNQINSQFAALEKSINGKIGIYAIDTNNNQVIEYRENERFPIQSTFKLICVAALLHDNDLKKNSLNKKIFYTQSDMVF